MSRSKSVYFKGSVGMIEGKLHDATENDPSAPTALVLHPDPLAGGTMNNKVTYTIYKAYKDCGFNVLRINFRGVGASQGNLSDFDQPHPERPGVADVSAAMNWLHKEFPSSIHYCIGGFSFGSWIAMHTVMRRPEIEFFIAVAPPAKDRSFAFLDPCPISGFFIQPEKDTIAILEDVKKMVSSLDYGTAEIDFEVIPSATHLFEDYQDLSKDYLDILYEKMCAYINIKLATRISKPIRKKRRRRKKKDDDGED